MLKSLRKAKRGTKIKFYVSSWILWAAFVISWETDIQAFLHCESQSTHAFPLTHFIKRQFKKLKKKSKIKKKNETHTLPRHYNIYRCCQLYHLWKWYSCIQCCNGVATCTMKQNTVVGGLLPQPILNTFPYFLKWKDCKICNFQSFWEEKITVDFPVLTLIKN